jgi:hypothetical protein
VNEYQCKDRSCSCDTSRISQRVIPSLLPRMKYSHSTSTHALHVLPPPPALITPSPGASKRRSKCVNSPPPTLPPDRKQTQNHPATNPRPPEKDIPFLPSFLPFPRNPRFTAQHKQNTANEQTNGAVLGSRETADGQTKQGALLAASANGASLLGRWISPRELLRVRNYQAMLVFDYRVWCVICFGERVWWVSLICDE